MERFLPFFISLRKNVENVPSRDSGQLCKIGQNAGSMGAWQTTISEIQNAKRI
jgi:hypothetical protein